MMKSNILNLRRALHFLHEVLFAILLMEFAMVIFVKEQPVSYAWLLVLLVYGFSYIARIFAINYAVAILIHAVPVGILYLLPLTTGMFFCLVLLDAYILSDCFAYMRRNGVLFPVSDFPWPTFVISLIIYVFGYYTESELVTKSAYVIPVILLFVYLTLLYLDGLERYVESTKDVYGVPLKKIIWMNSGMVLVVFALVAVGILMGKVFSLNEALVSFLKSLLVFVRIFARIVGFVFTMLASFVSTEPVSSQGYEIVKPGEKSVVMNSMLGVADFLGKIILLILAIFLAYKLLMFLIRVLFQRRRGAMDVVEEVKQEKKKAFSNYRLKRKQRITLQADEKFRRLYKNRIKRYQYDIRLLPEKTCRDIEQELLTEEIADVQEMTELYANVRYGTTKVDAKALNQMKQLSKK